MPFCQSTGRPLKGDRSNNKSAVPSRDDVIAHLRKNRMVVVQVRAAPREFKLNFKIGGGVKTRDIVVLTRQLDRKSTRLNSSHSQISYAVFCLKKKKKKTVREVALDVT